MQKELRKLDKQNRNKSNYIRVLQNRGKINKYINEKGYICYDPCEFRAYKKNAKVGRPIKQIKKGE